MNDEECKKQEEEEEDVEYERKRTRKRGKRRKGGAFRRPPKSFVKLLVKIDCFVASKFMYTYAILLLRASNFTASMRRVIECEHVSIETGWKM